MQEYNKTKKTVIPANPVLDTDRGSVIYTKLKYYFWIPAFAGMTID